MSIFICLAFIPFYLIGTFPTGMLIARSYGVDITKEGSGNIGATNIARTLGKKAGILTLLVDCIKGALAVIFAWILFSDSELIALAGFTAVLGHCFSIPGKLRGGKGIATSFGMLIILAPWTALVSAIAFAAVFLITRIVSLSSLSAALIAPISALIIYPNAQWHYVIALTSALVIYRHRENVQRIIEGREAKFTSNVRPEAQ